ncbi:MAG: hypothetical protein NWR12_12930 [Haliea sp.]|nr:hypothetical protein [Haliea sp.]
MSAAELYDFTHEDFAGDALHNTLRLMRERNPVCPAHSLVEREQDV